MSFFGRLEISLRQFPMLSNSFPQPLYGGIILSKINFKFNFLNLKILIFVKFNL